MELSGTTEIFHDGERLLQSDAGIGERLAAIGSQLIRDHMPDQHRAFFAQLPFVIVGSVDRGGQPWASLLCNPPGFISASDSRQLSISALPMATDPLHQVLVSGSTIALLGIEQHTRRRNRMNGLVTQVRPTGFDVEVQQSFGNCPKYIQARQVEYWPRAAVSRSCDSSALNPRMKQIIENADTFFIASAHPQANKKCTPAHGVDVSHRGGKPGFVRIDEDNNLLVPDFSGNHFFNTLGNLLLNPRAGLLFIDFETGDLLYLATEAEIMSAGAAVESFVGAERIIRFKINQVRHVVAAAPLRWQGAVQQSPFLAQTGSW